MVHIENGDAPGGKHKGVKHGEAITREQALYRSTNWASYYRADEENLGTIEPGKLADLTIIDKNFLTVPEDEMGELKVLMTLAEGKVLY